MTGTSRVPHALVLSAGALMLAACSVSLPTGGTRTQPTPTPRQESSGSQTQNPAQSQAPPPTPGPASTGTFDAVHAAQVLGPSVALLIVTSRGGTSEGSGFVIQSQGGTSYLATNNHVVEGSTKVQVLMPDGRHYSAQVQGTDPLEDVAVVKVADNLPVAQFADSTRTQVGEPVVAIGSPLGAQGFGTVTTGVISALHRTIQAGGGASNPENLADVLQTDAPINRGNSGGPLGDGNGRVVGMNTAGNTSANNIGYAIPSRLVQRVAQNLIAGKSPGHPYLGVCFTTIQDELAVDANVKGYGVVVKVVAPSTPAERAGVQKGDVIEKVDGVDLNNGETLGGVLQLHNPGDVVKLSALRGGGVTELTATLGDRPAGGAPAC